jgi:small subunit ribosomal protein S13
MKKEDATEKAEEGPEQEPEEKVSEEPNKEPAGNAEEGPKEAPAAEPDEASEPGKEESGAKDENAEKKPEKKAGKSLARKIVRIGSKDLNGEMTVKRGLQYVPGVSFMLANAVSSVCGFADKKVGDLSDDEKKKLEDIMAHPDKYEIKPWLYNRRFDPEDGLDKHLIAAQLELKRKMDINELKKRKCYRGVRHITGLPVRGQRTRSSFRKSATVGVSRVKAKPKAGSKGK